MRSRIPGGGYTLRIMHPRPRPLLLLLALAGAARAQFGGGPVPVSVDPVAETEVAEAIVLPGTALAWQSTVVASPEEGLVVERVRGYFSTPVKKGDPLVRLDDTRARARADAARAQVAAERARYDELLAGERPEEISAAEAEHRRALAAEKQAVQNLERIRSLAAKAAATPDELDQAVRQADVARQDARAARFRLDRLQAGSRKEVRAYQKATWEAAKAQAALAEKALADQVVRAPYDGFVDTVYIEVGSWLEKGGSVLDMVDPSKIDVGILIPETVIRRVPRGADAECRFASDQGEIRVTGKVVALGPRATLQGRTVPIVVRFDNPDGRVLPGMSARVAVPVGAPSSRVTVHKDAINRSSDGSTLVWIVEQGKAAMRSVQLGRDVADRVVVESGLKAGDQAVIRGNERLRPGQEVSTGASGEAPKGAGSP